MDTLRWAVVLVLCTPLAAPADGSRIVPIELQSARDRDRLRILQEELAREQGRSDQAVQRRAERLAASDPAGVQEADALFARTQLNLQALRAELQTAAREPAANAAIPAKALRPAAARSGAWWDVYAKAPRPDPSRAASSDGAAPP